jgi:DNA-binding transcriptional ArsR family regulator
MNKCSCKHWLPSIGETTQLAKLAKTLSGPTKLKILAALLSRRHCVCEIESCLGKEQSLVSHHLADLVTSGWLTQAKKGRKVFYQLKKDKIKILKMFLKKGGIR